MLAEKERTKYADVWQFPDYLKTSPGEYWSDLFGKMASPQKGQAVLDIGCGAGAGGKALRGKYDLCVTFLDLDNFGNLEPFKKQPLWKPIVGHYDFGYCCDVMEHIPKELTMLCIHNALQACDRVFFSISFLPDHFGKYVGEPLHLTVEPFSWWRDRLREVGTLLDARDMLGEGVFLVES